MTTRFIILLVYVLLALLPLASMAFGQVSQADMAKVAGQCGLYAYRARITDVYDGDTVTADIDLGFKVWRHGEKLRLFGVDAPEMRGDERTKGQVSRDALHERIIGREVVICTLKDKTGKYGRYLAEIFVEGESVNAWLIRQGYAKPYSAAITSVKKSSIASLVTDGERFVRAAFQ